MEKLNFAFPFYLRYVDDIVLAAPAEFSSMYLTFLILTIIDFNSPLKLLLTIL